MAKPWEKYGSARPSQPAAPAAAAKPWQRYAAPPAATPWILPGGPTPVADKITSDAGMTGTAQKVASAAISPVTEYFPRQRANAQAGLDQMSRGVDRIGSGDVGAGALETTLGALGYVGSPVTAALQPISDPINNLVSQPVEKVTGIPKEITTPVLTSLTPGLGIVRAPGAKAPPVNVPAMPRVSREPVPTNQQLKSAAGRAYKAADDAGVILKPQAITRMKGELESELAEFGFHPELQPGAATVLKELDRVAGGNITLKGLDTVRKIANNAPNVTNRADVKATGKIVKHIDRMLENISKDDVLMGNAEVGVTALRNARHLWNRVAKSEMIDTAIEKATRQAARTGSGGNIENSLRQKFSTILESPSKIRGFTPKEKVLMERIVRGRGGLHETLRLVGKLSPRGNGLMAAIWGGAGVGTMNPAFLAPPAIGFVSKLGSEAMTRGSVAKLSEAVRGGPPQNRLSALRDGTPRRVPLALIPNSNQQ